MKISSFILASLFAGAGGAIAGTLFAPNKGSKTRSKIAKKGHEYTDYLVNNFNEMTDSVSHPFENSEDQIIRLSERAINKAKKLRPKSIIN